MAWLALKVVQCHVEQYYGLTSQCTILPHSSFLQMESGDQVLGHFSCTNSGQLQPLLLESSPLFIAVVNDDVEAVRSAIEAPGAVSRLHLVLHWSSDVEEGACEAKRSRTLVKSRTLLHVACLCGSQKVSRLLLDAGANPQQMSPDGLTARQASMQSLLFCFLAP